MARFDGGGPLYLTSGSTALSTRCTVRKPARAFPSSYSTPPGPMDVSGRHLLEIQTSNSTFVCSPTTCRITPNRCRRPAWPGGKQSIA